VSVCCCFGAQWRSYVDEYDEIGTNRLNWHTTTSGGLLHFPDELEPRSFRSVSVITSNLADGNRIILPLVTCGRTKPAAIRRVTRRRLRRWLVNDTNKMSKIISPIKWDGCRQLLARRKLIYCGGVCATWIAWHFVQSTDGKGWGALR